jgi:hypothetical protein
MRGLLGVNRVGLGTIVETGFGVDSFSEYASRAVQLS